LHQAEKARLTVKGGEMIFRRGNTRPKILSALDDLDFATFDGDPYDLNIIGVRTESKISNRFDDFLHVCFRLDGIWVEEIYPCTVDPGQYHLSNPGRLEGCAVICSPQQMRSTYTIGLHRGQYECLVNRKPVAIWRDNNKDEIIDTDSDRYEGWGIHIHKAGRNSTEVNKWSAGCTVLKEERDFDRLMELARKQVSSGFGSWYTYTVIDGVYL